MILIFRLMMLIVIVLLLLFCMSNLDTVTVKLLGWQSPEIPLFLLLLFVFFFGFFLALVWQAWHGFGTSRPAHTAQPAAATEKEKKPKRRWGRKEKIGKTAAEGTEEKIVADDSAKTTAGAEMPVRQNDAQQEKPESADNEK
ncbi:MAG: hypothetical protein C0623_12300 [Desulfuromonas sp.]|nr:MAG: hypothetical protein C0623_12300 [Desulfuromonas sp.]